MQSISERSMTLEPFGLQVELVGDDDALRVTPASRITPEARAYIQAHKETLREQLLSRDSFRPVGDISAGLVTALAIGQPTPAPALPADLLERVNLICQMERWPDGDKQELCDMLHRQIERDGVPVRELVALLDAHLARHHGTIDDTSDDGEAIEERAAIMEHDGGLPRGEAEQLAGQVNDCMTCRHWLGVQTFAEPRFRALAAAGVEARPKSMVMGTCRLRNRPWRCSNIAGSPDYFRWHFIGQCGRQERT